jgi:hypothetical protein
MSIKRTLNIIVFLLFPVFIFSQNDTLNQKLQSGYHHHIKDSLGRIYRYIKVSVPEYKLPAFTALSH